MKEMQVKTVAVVLCLAMATMAIATVPSLANKMNGKNYGSSDRGMSNRAKKAIKKGYQSQDLRFVNTLKS